MFVVPAMDSLLTQGDLIDDCPLFSVDMSLPSESWAEAPLMWQSRIVVLTQACDLAQSKASWVAVATVYDAQRIVELGGVKATTIRDQIRRHQYFGWYFLPASTPPGNLPESLVDLHTVPPAVLEKLILDGKRVGRLLTPYREHLAQHFAISSSRIALPEPYDTQP